MTATATDILNPLASHAPATLAALWMPEQRSTYAGEVDTAFYFVLWVSVFFSLLITALVIFFSVRRWDGGTKGAQHGHGGRGKLGKGPTHNTALEMTWTVIPMLIVIVIFVLGFRPFRDITTPPDDAYPVTVEAKKWDWQFNYESVGKYAPDGKLHVPAGTPVVLSLRSSDVIHSLYVPAFRTKQDVVPGRFNKTWFEAIWSDEDAETWTYTDADGNRMDFEVNRYPLYCTEYCGTGHAQMLSEVVVHTRSGFAKWLEALPDPDAGPPHEIGARIVKGRGGCITCHSVDGSINQAPSFKDLFGKQEQLVSGTVTVDEEYIYNSIRNPQSQIVARFEGAANMSVYPESLLSDRDVDYIIAYLKTISKHVDTPSADELPGESDAESGEASGE